MKFESICDDTWLLSLQAIIFSRRKLQNLIYSFSFCFSQSPKKILGLEMWKKQIKVIYTSSRFLNLFPSLLLSLIWSYELSFVWFILSEWTIFVPACKIKKIIYCDILSLNWNSIYQTFHLLFFVALASKKGILGYVRLSIYVLLISIPIYVAEHKI